MSPIKPPIVDERTLDSKILAHLKEHPLQRMTAQEVASELDRVYEVEGEVFVEDERSNGAIVVFKRASDPGGILWVTQSFNRLAKRHPMNVMHEPESETYYWKT
jgi:hypothetical protein